MLLDEAILTNTHNMRRMTKEEHFHKIYIFFWESLTDKQTSLNHQR